MPKTRVKLDSNSQSHKEKSRLNSKVAGLSKIFELADEWRKVASEFPPSTLFSNSLLLVATLFAYPCNLEPVKTSR